MQIKPVIFNKHLAPSDANIIYRHSEKQLELEDFQLPISGRLSADNRRVRLAQMIPWYQFKEEYCATLFKKGQGHKYFWYEWALEALNINERLEPSDEE